MSGFFYNLGVKSYFSALKLISPWHSKAKKMLEGREKAISDIQQNISESKKHVWVHVSSLGEFEQSRPLLEKIRQEYPDVQVILTFFSPSGYDVKKQTPLADIVTYLPADSSDDLERFIRLMNPSIAIFVKYEFWLNTLQFLYSNNIPTFIVSAIFRKDQPFFKWWGKQFRVALNHYNHLFVQDRDSENLLMSLGIDKSKITVAGDTRADRVFKIASSPKSLPNIEKFIKNDNSGKKVVIAGSSWGNDEEIYLPILLQRQDVKIIIAPHEISPKRLEKLEERCGEPVFYWSKLESYNDLNSSRILIIDNFGFLSSIYQYGDIGYIGGGFGRGIHNILEASVYGIPVIFGPNYKKFKEARDLIAVGGAFSITSKEECEEIFSTLLEDSNKSKTAGDNALKYLSKNIGATDKIFNIIGPYLR